MWYNGASFVKRGFLPIMRRFLNRDQIKPLLIAVMLVGVAGLLIGLYRFIDASNQLQSNPAFLAQSGGSPPVNVGSQEEATALIAASIEMRRLQGQRNEAVIFIGAGVALTALGWLGLDFLRPRRKKKAEASA
jgi:hypothetical protein